MRVHHLNCGTMAPFGGRLISGTSHPFTTAHLVCHCLLIENGDGLVLVDTGFGLETVAHPRELLGGRFLRLIRPRLDATETAVRQIERLGYAAEDVRHIVLTHLDVDHAGGLADFPNARVHVSAVEMAAAEQPATRLERERYRPALWAHAPHWVTHTADGETWFGFESARELPGLPPEIALVPLGGHTRGHVGVAIDMSGSVTEPGGEPAPGTRRWLLHAGDAYFFRGQLDATRPHCPPGLRAFQATVQADKRARLHNTARLRELAARDEVRVFSAHDPLELARAASPDPEAPTGRTEDPIAERGA
jgi:glyoxylase-like metal-dependent hydrolase (beta-lactamase superfamily II)